MSQTAVIHARIDPATKAATERILESIGLTPTEAIRLLYRQIAMRGEFPVELRTPNAATAEVLAKVARGDPNLKMEAEAIFQELGLSTTEAIRMFLAQVRLRKGLPFRVETLAANDDLLVDSSMRQAALDSVFDD